jgi:NTP pyrophosphatase (non-canonical NTP hydrolase)
MGASTEAGELLDSLKKAIFYGKELDVVNFKEELGDILWYIAIAYHELGGSFEEGMEVNIAKLRARYGDKFTAARALKRDLDVERKILEGVQANVEADVAEGKYDNWEPKPKPPLG